MNTELLIDAVVRQTTILIAQLATAGGARTPLSDVGGQVFVDLARELHRQGVSRKVAADMFGMALRTYRRKIQRLGESETVAGRSLWEAVHDHVGQQPVVTRADVLRRFHRDDESTVRGVLQDLVDSGLVYQAGRGALSSYRVATRADLDYVRENERESDGMDMLVWAIVYRLGPLSRSKLAEHLALPATKLDASLSRLVESGRVVVEGDRERTYRAPSFVLPLGAPQGWEAAVFDHFQAVVNYDLREAPPRPRQREQRRSRGREHIQPRGLARPPPRGRSNRRAREVSRSPRRAPQTDRGAQRRMPHAGETHARRRLCRPIHRGP